MLKAGVKIFNAKGRVEGAHNISLSSGEEFSTKHILVAVGGAPYIPKFEGSNYSISSNEIFDLKVFNNEFLLLVVVILLVSFLVFLMDWAQM